MDGILQDLGVEFVDESESERLVMGSNIEILRIRYGLLGRMNVILNAEDISQ